MLNIKQQRIWEEYKGDWLDENDNLIWANVTFVNVVDANLGELRGISFTSDTAVITATLSRCLDKLART